MRQRKIYNIPFGAIADALHSVGTIVEIGPGKAIPFAQAWTNGCFIELDQVKQTLGLFFFHDDEADGMQGVPPEVHGNAKILNPNPLEGVRPAEKFVLDTDIKFDGNRLVMAAVGEQGEAIMYLNQQADKFSKAGYMVIQNETKEGMRPDGSFFAIVVMQLMPDPHAPAQTPAANELAARRSDEIELAEQERLKSRSMAERRASDAAKVLHMEGGESAVDEKKVIPKLSQPKSRSDAILAPKDRPDKPKEEIAEDTAEKMLAKIREFGIKKHSDPAKDPNIDPEVLAKMKQAAKPKE